MYYVHYESKYYYDFKDKLLAIIIKDIQEELEATRKNEKEILYHEDMKENLIVNSDFNLANDFWSYWDNDFKIIPLYIDGKLENILNLNKSDLVTDKYKQVWSNSIEINTNGDKEFQLSFDIKVDKISKVDSLGNIFCIRTFNELDKIFNKDCVWNKFINISEIQGLENSKWTTFTCRIKPEKGKFMKISPFLTRNGDVSWKNIKLSLIN